MEISHLEVIGALMGAVLAAGIPAFRASQRSQRLEDQVGSNGDPDALTIRQIIIEIQDQLFDLIRSSAETTDALREHDARTKATYDQVQRIERKLNDHLVNQSDSSPEG